MAKVKVDSKKCIGCGLCESICSDVFRLKDDGKAHVISQDCGKNCDCKSAAESCPVQAITYEE
jgi:ferredoxin